MSDNVVMKDSANNNIKAPAVLRPRGSNHVGMRQFNERVVLHAIRLHGQVPKAELARLTGLTAQTIGLITTRLAEDDLLIHHAPVRGKIGQPSIPLSLNPDGAYALGVKIGRRSMDLLLVDFTGAVRHRKNLQYDFPKIDDLLPAIASHLAFITDYLGASASRLIGIGVAAPFNMGGWHKMLGVSQTTAHQWNEIDLCAQVQQLTDIPVSFVKDTQAACVAELVAGRGRDLKSFLYIFVDTFVGGGLVLNSHLHAGVHGNAGAVASLPIHIASDDISLTENIAPAQLVGLASLWELEQRYIKANLLAAAAYDERSLAEPYWEHTQAWLNKAALGLAQSIVSGTAFLDVKTVVIDSSSSKPLLERLIEQTNLALTRYNWEGLWPAQIVAGDIGYDAGALGGALLPLHENFAPDRDLFLKALD